MSMVTLCITAPPYVKTRLSPAPCFAPSCPSIGLVSHARTFLFHSTNCFQYLCANTDQYCGQKGSVWLARLPLGLGDLHSVEDATETPQVSKLSNLFNCLCLPRTPGWFSVHTPGTPEAIRGWSGPTWCRWWRRTSIIRARSARQNFWLCYLAVRRRSQHSPAKSGSLAILNVSLMRAHLRTYSAGFYYSNSV